MYVCTKGCIYLSTEFIPCFELTDIESKLNICLTMYIVHVYVLVYWSCVHVNALYA